MLVKFKRPDGQFGCASAKAFWRDNTKTAKNPAYIRMEFVAEAENRAELFPAQEATTVKAAKSVPEAPTPEQLSELKAKIEAEGFDKRTLSAQEKQWVKLIPAE